jgi:hypothetical protein
MLNVYKNIDSNEEVDRSDKYEEEVQTPFEFCVSDYNVNYFGLGRSVEDCQ